MASGFSGDVFYGAGQGTARATSLTTLTGLQQQQGGALSTMDQMVQRRGDLVIGKRSFGDYQQPYQQQQSNPLLVLQQQQQQQATLSCFQQQQQQYLMRSVKPRTLSSSFVSNNPNSISSPPSSRFGAPIYGQLRQQPQQHQQIFNNNNNFLHHNNNQFNPTNNCLISNLSSTNLMNPIQIQTQNPGYSTIGYSNLIQPKPESQLGYSNLAPPKADHPDFQDHKILNTLHELEKQLLNDDDNNDNENDAVSVITNSEWSETFQTLMGASPNPGPSPGPGPTPSPNQTCSSTSGSNNSHNNNPLNNNNNHIISPSPTSSTSSCCSTSAPPQQPPPPETLSPKQLIIEAGNAIIERKTEAVKEFLTRLNRISNPKGNSEQRLGFYLGNALRSRAFPSENYTPVLELYSKDQLQAMYSLNDMSPCFKFGLLAANLVMLEAITIALQEGVKVHVIDFDVGQGGQYVNLLRALAERRSQLAAGGGCELKVTVVDTDVDSHGGVMESVRDGLIKLAEGVGINLKLNGLTRKITELTRELLGCEESEAVIVNLAFKLHRVPDESVSVENLRDELLRRVKGLNPRAVTLVEQEMNGNTAPFLTRVNEACGYYGALFESLNSTLTRENMNRVRVEEGLGRKLANTVACEGRERVERAEVFGKWRARMGMAGFELKPLSPNVAESMRVKLNSARNGNPGFTVKEESGGVGFGWMGRTLTVASAWR